MAKPKLDTSKTEWDLSPLLASDDDPKIQEYRNVVTKAANAFAQKWRSRTDYLEDPAALKQALDEFEALERLPGGGNEEYYFYLKAQLDTGDPKIKAKVGQASEFNLEIINKLQFFWLSIGKASENAQRKFIADKNLEPYRHWLETKFAQAKYTLGEQEEKIIRLKADPAHGQWRRLVDGLLARAEKPVLLENGKTKIATQEEMHSLTRSKNKKVRDKAASAWNEVMAEKVDIAEAEFNALLKNKKIDDELRGFERPEMARHISDDIDTKVVDALIKSVSSRNDISQRFYALKAKLLGVPTLAYHERNQSVGEVDKQYSYKEACALVYEVFNDLDPEFAQIFSSMLEGGQLDAFPKKGKRGGAFCSSGGINHRSYIMLNHTDKLRDVETIAHEMGHAINNELIRPKQNALNFDTPLSTAEVASTFMEDFVYGRLVADATNEERLQLNMGKLDSLVAMIFRQTAFYRFEQEVHKQFRDKGYLSKEEIGEIYLKPVNDYLGPSVEQLPGYENWWVYIPHFRSFFYVYSYVSGHLISSALQAKTRADKKFIGKVKQFLAAGTSRSPQDLFADMGIDIADKSFWQEGLKEIDRLLKDTESLAKELGKA